MYKDILTFILKINQQSPKMNLTLMSDSPQVLTEVIVAESRPVVDVLKKLTSFPLWLIY